MGMSLDLYAIMSQQDDWDKEPLHRKLNYYIIYAGDKKFLIPKPFEVGAIFSTIPEVFIDGIRNKDGAYVADAVTQIFLNNFSFNPIPQAISPVLEVATNRDFFRGRELESLGVRGLPTEMRAYSTTSEFAKLVGQGSATRWASVRLSLSNLLMATSVLLAGCSWVAWTQRSAGLARSQKSQPVCLEMALPTQQLETLASLGL